MGTRITQTNHSHASQPTYNAPATLDYRTRRVYAYRGSAGRREELFC